MRMAYVHNLEKWQKCVTILMDEMCIRQDIVYDK